MSRSRVLQFANVGFWVIVVAVGVGYVAPKWQQFELSSRLARLDPAWAFGAIALLLAQYLLVFQLWRRVLRMLHGPAPAGLLFRAFGLSLLPKYLPGKIFGAGLRAGLTASAGIPYPIVVGSLLWEIGLTLAVAIAITAYGIVAGTSRDLDPVGRWLILGIFLATITGLIASIVPRVRNLAATWLHPGVARQQPAKMAALFAGYLGAWLVYAAAHWMLARAIAPLSLGSAVPLLVSLAASWVLGVLSLLAPGGLGVREGALFLFARGAMGAPTALLFVTMSRLLIFAVEVLLTLVAWAFGPRPITPRSTSDPHQP